MNLHVKHKAFDVILGLLCVSSSSTTFTDANNSLMSRTCSDHGRFT